MVHQDLKVKWPRAPYEDTSFYIYNYNEHTVGILLILMLIYFLYAPFITHLSVPGREEYLTYGFRSGFFFFPKRVFFFRFFLIWVEGLRTDMVITLKTVKASEANTDLGL